VDLEANNLEPKALGFRQKFTEKIKSIPPNWIKLLPVILILAALPVTVALVKLQTSVNSHAQDLQVSLSSNPNTISDQLNVNDPIEDDYIPNDPGPVITASEGQAIYNSMVSKIDTQPSVIATTTKPNIVFLLIDDINPIDGRMFTSALTPSINTNIVAKGINFANYFGETPLCCPGRVGFLTGQHTQNHGVQANYDGKNFKGSETIAVELQNMGYQTVFAGKYVNSFSLIPAINAVPPGWSSFDGIYEGNGKYYNYRYIHTNHTITYHGNTATDYSTDVIANSVIQDFKGTPADKPIFAWIAPTSIHMPDTPAPRHVDDPKCANIQGWAPPDYNELNVSDKPAWVRALPLLNANSWKLTQFCNNMLGVDDLMARVVKELTAEGRYNNTIFILAGDNGMGWGEHRWGEKKLQIYTTHIPFYVAWPSGRGDSPRLEETTLSNIDFAPTFCELAGCVMGPYPNGQQIADGVSFLSLIKDQPVTFNRDAILEHAKRTDAEGDWWAIKTTPQSGLGLWEYNELNSGERELYDISNGPCYLWTPSMGGDPCELFNLLGPTSSPSQATLDLAAKLSARLAQLKTEKGYSPTPSITPTPTPTSNSGFLESGGHVVFEGEHYSANISRNSHTWVVSSDSTAVGGAYINTSNAGVLFIPPNSAETQYNIYFSTPGTYYVWLRGNAPNGTSNAIGVGIDGTPTTNPINFGKYNSWIWNNFDLKSSPVKVTVSSAGLHTFSIWERKDGTKLDRVMLTTSSSVPSGNGPTESPIVTPTPTFTLTPTP
jgi:arylsulfatase A-like enzyme